MKQSTLVLLLLPSLLSEGGYYSLAAAPAVSNRAPAADDIGYLPADGASVGTNPPALAWLPEPGAGAYAVQLARDIDFDRGVIEIERTPYVLYTHDTTLAPGTWYWRYASIDRTDVRSAWSQVRRFHIAADAQRFPRPSEEQIRKHLPKRHPRLMMRPEEVETVRKSRLGAQKQPWDELVRTAERYLELPLVDEPPPWTGGTWNADEWRRNYREATRASEIAETLAFCYLLSGDQRYGEGARRWLLHIATWDPGGSTSMAVNDEAGMPILYGTSRAYDWVYHFLSETDRTTLREMVRTRGEEAYRWLREKPFEQKAYNSHGGRMWHFLGEAAIAYYGEVPEATKWLAYAITIFWGWYPSYGDEEGGWAQGYNYWSSYINRSTWWLDALRAALRVEGTDKPFYRRVGDFPMYVAPPRGSLTGFGDFAERRPDPQAAAVVGYFARIRQKPEWQWYAEAWGQDRAPNSPIEFLRAARPSSPRVKAKPPTDWPTAKLFHGAGWASLSGNLLDARRGVQVMLRAAPLGNISHSHADQNAIVLGAYGSPLLVNTGIRPWYGSPFCKAWYWATKAHNALEIDGQGQPKTAEATGKVILFQPGPAYDYVVGEATGYGEHVKRYRRHLVFLKPNIIVLVDEVRASRPVSLKFWLHGRAPFTIDEQNARVGLTYENASLDGTLLAPSALRLEQTDQYPIPPETGTPEPEWHLSAETLQKHADARFVAVLGVAKAGQKGDVSEPEDVSTEDGIIVRFRQAGKLVHVSFDTAGPAVAVR